MSDAVSSVVWELAQGAAGEFEAQVLDITFTPHQSRAVLRVIVEPVDETIDSVDIDVIARLSRALARALDDADPIASKYVLEVSSPGADQPLLRPRDFRRNITRTVVVEHPSFDMPVTGRIDAVDEDTVVLANGDSATVTVPLTGITSAHVVLPW
ncbi:MAG: hypothetical protein WD360_06940 [Nitriliruptoraceae bacterium]